LFLHRHEAMPVVVLRDERHSLLERAKDTPEITVAYHAIVRSISYASLPSQETTGMMQRTMP
jgi:hypothetical protein